MNNNNLTHYPDRSCGTLNEVESQFIIKKPVRYLGQLNEVIGDAVELKCSHQSCEQCSGSGFNKDGSKCPKAIACNCPICCGLWH